MARPTTSLLARLGRDHRGGTAIEYGLILSLIVIVMIVSFQLVANSTVGLWGNISDKVASSH